MRDCWSQDASTVRVEWGPYGAQALSSYAAERGPVVAVVIDVLSFTTCVSVAVDAGMTVWPYRWKDESAQAFAEERGAALAVGRSVAATAGVGAISLSPKSIRAAQGSVERLVLPSPNGSTISALLAESGASVVAASLRNRTAVASWIVDRLDELAAAARGQSSGVVQPAVVIVPAGERWPDGSLRPAVEDLWGAGAVVEAIVSKLDHRGGPMLLSPEAELGLLAWQGVAAIVPGSLAACASGRELIEMGFPEDVEIASEVDASALVPVLDATDGAFRPA